MVKVEWLILLSYESKCKKILFTLFYDPKKNNEFKNILKVMSSKIY